MLWLNKPANTMLSLRSPDDIHRPITQIVRAPGFAEYLDLQRYDDPMEMVSPADENRRLLLRVVPYDRDRRLLLVRDVTRLHRLEEVRKSFVANVSHELRSPLTVVSGYLESMSDDPELAERWGRPIQLMSQQSDRMRLIVEDLLRLSQMESDPGGARHEPVRVAEMLENI
ncbi:MAG: hypothetical protein KDK70_44645, partial [Myxococcales bacterium]|nr:hypothetical protein [Myxococcales bacterium]